MTFFSKLAQRKWLYLQCICAAWLALHIILIWQQSINPSHWIMNAWCDSFTFCSWEIFVKIFSTKIICDHRAPYTPIARKLLWHNELQTRQLWPHGPFIQKFSTIRPIGALWENFLLSMETDWNFQILYSQLHPMVPIDCTCAIWSSLVQVLEQVFELDVSLDVFKSCLSTWKTIFYVICCLIYTPCSDLPYTCMMWCSMWVKGTSRARYSIQIHLKKTCCY